MDEHIEGVEEQGVADSATQLKGVEEQGVADSAMDDDVFDNYIEGIMEGVPENGEGAVEKSEEASASKTENAAEPFKSFATEEEYQKEIDRIFSKRFHNFKQVTAERDEMFENLKDFYGTDNAEEAYKMFNEQITASKAKNAGMSVDEYKEQSELEKKAKAYDDQMEYQTRVEQERQRLISEAEQIKSNDKTFDLFRVYNSDKNFKADLDRTGSVYLAYANYVKNGNSASEIPSAENKNNVSIDTKRSFKESGTAKSSSRGRVSSSPADLSDDDFEDYIKKIEGDL